jgi:hypothetical protein
MPMRVAEPPAIDAPPADDALVRRGMRHVQVGLVTSVVATLSLLAIVVAGTGAGRAIGVSGWIGALLAEAVFVAALLSGSRIVRGLMVITGALNVVTAGMMLLMRASVMSAQAEAGLPLGALALGIGAHGAGCLLATATPAARAWFRARRAMFAARRKAKSLGEWRSATPREEGR